MTESPGSAMRAAFAGVCALALAIGLGRFFYTPVLPPMLEAGRISASEGGLAAGANFLGYLLGALAASSPRFSARRYRWTAYVALPACGVTLLLSGLWMGFVPFAIIRFAGGVASAFSMVFVSAIVMRIFQDNNRPGLFSLYFSGVGFGIVFAAMIVPLASASWLGWPAMWYAAGAIALLLWLVTLVLLPASAVASEPLPHSVDGQPQSPAGFAAAFWVLLIGYGFFGFGYSVSATFLNTIAKADPVLAPAEPWVWFVVGLSGIPSIWAWNRLVGRIGLAYTYSIACFVEAAGILLLLWHATPATLLVSGLTLGATFMAVTALGLAKARSMATHKAAAALALMTASFGLGQMIGPVLAGFLFESSGSFAMALAAAITALAATVVLTLLSKRLEA